MKADTARETIVLDSSCWIEYFVGSQAAMAYVGLVKTTDVIVPTISIFEVMRELLRRFDNDDVLKAIAFMQQHTVVPLTEGVATNAAQLALHLNMSSADAIICATAWQHKATLYTHDSDLEGVENVVYLPKPEKEHPSH